MNSSKNNNTTQNSIPIQGDSGNRTTPWFMKRQVNFQKGLIVALYIGIAMVFIPGFVRLFSYRFTIGMLVLLIIQILSAVAAVYFLNKDIRVSILLFVVFVIATLFQPMTRSYRGFHVWESGFDAKYTSYCLARAVEIALAAFVLIGLNRANKPLAIAAAILLAILDTYWIVTTHMLIPPTGDSDNWDGILMWTAYYSELIIPMLLLICAINPHAIHNSILIIDGYMAVRLVLFIAADLLSDSYYRVHDLYYLLNTCWLPVMLIFGMNAVLVFPIRFKQLAKVFGLSLLVVALFALLAAAQQTENESKKQNEQSRQEYLNEMRDNILSWKKAGFSDNFTTDAALQMYKEGRVTASEYKWLVQQLIGKQ